MFDPCRGSTFEGAGLPNSRNDTTDLIEGMDVGAVKRRASWDEEPPSVIRE